MGGLLLGQVQFKDLQLLVAARVIDHRLHQEAVELGLGQVVGTLLLHRILGGEDHEQLGQGVGALADGDLLLGHGLQQGRLHLGRGAVDLVGQQDVVEERAGAKLELALFVAVDVGADQVRGQQVRGELDAVKVALQGLGQGLDRRGLGQARHALHQQVAIAEQADEHAVDEAMLADDARGDMVADGFEVGGGHEAGTSGFRHDERARARRTTEHSQGTETRVLPGVYLRSPRHQRHGLAWGGPRRAGHRCLAAASGAGAHEKPRPEREGPNADDFVAILQAQAKIGNFSGESKYSNMLMSPPRRSRALGGPEPCRCGP